MSTEVSPAPTPVAPIPPAPTERGNVLPEGIKVDYSHSATGFFERQQAVNKGEKPVDGPTGNTGPVGVEGKSGPVKVNLVVVEEPAKGNLAAKLAKPKVANPTATPVAKVDDGKSFVEKLDTAPDPEPGKAGEHFKTWKGQAKHEIVGLQTRVRELEAQVATAKTAAPVPVATEEVERLKAEHKTMSERLLILDVQAHPAFKTQFTEPKRAAIEAAQELLKAGEIEGVDVTALLNKPRSEFGKAVSEAGAKLSDYDRTDFAEQMRKAYTIAQNERDALGKSKETLQAIQQSNNGRAKQAFAAVEQELTAKAGEFMPALEEPANATPEQRQAIETYNEAVKSLPAAARKLAFDSNDEKTVATSAFKAAAYDLHVQHVLPRILAEYDEVVSVNRGLTQELAAIRSRNPNLQRHGPASSGDGSPDPSKMNHADAAEYYANGGGRR
jgi:uncharacterized protein YukE